MCVLYSTATLRGVYRERLSARVFALSFRRNRATLVVAASGSPVPKVTEEIRQPIKGTKYVVYDENMSPFFVKLIGLFGIFLIVGSFVSCVNLGVSKRLLWWTLRTPGPPPSTPSSHRQSHWRPSSEGRREDPIVRR